jgi:hypothetical protein
MYRCGNRSESIKKKTSASRNTGPGMANSVSAGNPGARRRAGEYSADISENVINYLVDEERVPKKGKPGR